MNRRTLSCKRPYLVAAGCLLLLVPIVQAGPLYWTGRSISEPELNTPSEHHNHLNARYTSAPSDTDDNRQEEVVSVPNVWSLTNSYGQGIVPTGDSENATPSVSEPASEAPSASSTCPEGGFCGITPIEDSTTPATETAAPTSPSVDTGSSTSEAQAVPTSTEAASSEPITTPSPTSEAGSPQDTVPTSVNSPGESYASDTTPATATQVSSTLEELPTSPAVSSTPIATPPESSKQASSPALETPTSAAAPTSLESSTPVETPTSAVTSTSLETPTSPATSTSLASSTLPQTPSSLETPTSPATPTSLVNSTPLEAPTSLQTSTPLESSSPTTPTSLATTSGAGTSNTIPTTPGSAPSSSLPSTPGSSPVTPTPIVSTPLNTPSSVVIPPSSSLPVPQEPSASDAPQPTTPSSPAGSPTGEVPTSVVQTPSSTPGVSSTAAATTTPGNAPIGGTPTSSVTQPTEETLFPKPSSSLSSVPNNSPIGETSRSQTLVSPTVSFITIVTPSTGVEGPIGGIFTSHASQTTSAGQTTIPKPSSTQPAADSPTAVVPVPTKESTAPAVIPTSSPIGSVTTTIIPSAPGNGSPSSNVVQPTEETLFPKPSSTAPAEQVSTSPAGVSSILQPSTNEVPSVTKAPATTFITATPTGTTTVPSSTYDKNLAFAKQKNDEFKSLTPSSPCSTPGQPACINGSYAQCSSDGKYILGECSNGMSCVAIPWEYADVVKVGCWDTNDAKRILGGDISSPTSTAPADNVGTEPVTKQTTIKQTKIITRTAAPLPSTSAPEALQPTTTVVTLVPSSANNPSPIETAPSSSQLPVVPQPSVVQPSSEHSVPDQTSTVRTFPSKLPSIIPGPVETTSKDPIGGTTITNIINPPKTTGDTEKPTKTSSSSYSKWTNIIPIDDDDTTTASDEPQTIVASETTNISEVTPTADFTTTQTVNGTPMVSFYFTVTVTEKVRETATLIIPS